MGRQEPGTSVGRSLQYGSIGYGAGSTPDTTTLYAKATVQTDGAGGVIMRNVDNISQVLITGAGDIFLGYERSFENDNDFDAMEVTEQAPDGGVGGPNREFRNLRNKSKDGFSIRAIDLAAAIVDHAVVIRAYTVVVFGRGIVRG